MGEPCRVVGQISLRNSRQVEIYEPRDDLWACLNGVIFRHRPDGEPIPPHEILSAVLAHCSDRTLDEGSSFAELLGLVSAIVRSWPANDRMVRRYRPAVELALRRQAKILLETSKLIATAIDPPPAIEESIGRSVDRRLGEKFAPYLSASFSNRLAEPSRKEVPSPSDSRVSGAKQPLEGSREDLVPHRQMVTLNQAAGIVNRHKTDPGTLQNQWRHSRVQPLTVAGDDPTNGTAGDHATLKLENQFKRPTSSPVSAQPPLLNQTTHT